MPSKKDSRHDVIKGMRNITRDLLRLQTKIQECDHGGALAFVGPIRALITMNDKMIDATMNAFYGGKK